MIYRLYLPQDFDSLYALEAACFEPPFRFDRKYLRKLVQHPNGAAWIAGDEGKIAGFAIVEWAKRKSGVTAYIQTIEVAPEARGRGIASELLRRLEGSARQAGATLIRLHVEAGNPAAIRLYSAQGYRCEGRRENYYPLGKAALIYVKPLDSEPAS